MFSHLELKLCPMWPLVIGTHFPTDDNVWVVSGLSHAITEKKECISDPSEPDGRVCWETIQIPEITLVADRQGNSLLTSITNAARKLS